MRQLFNTDHDIEMDEMAEKDKKEFYRISIAMHMPAGFEAQFMIIASPTLTEIKDELLLDYFPVTKPRNGRAVAERALAKP